MKRYYTPLSTLALLTAFMVPLTSFADDTEIFFPTEEDIDTSDIQPNILFIFDSSGSMAWNVTTLETYDPNRAYIGTSTANTVYVYDTSYNYLGVSISNSRNNCQAMLDHLDDTPNTPVYIGKAAEWTTNNSDDVDRWKKISNSSNVVECKTDSGIHGSDASSTDIYAANGDDGPYSASVNETIVWAGFEDRLYVSANYHDYLTEAPQVTRVKMDVMKEAATDLLNSFEGVNVGLMRFNFNNGGYVLKHFEDIATGRTDIVNKVNSLTASDWTPLAETLWEAHNYFSGSSVSSYGTHANADPDASSGGKYKSPITNNSCQSNHIIYLTDGTPYHDEEQDSTISGLPGVTDCDHQDDARLPGNTCLDELAGYMANTHDYNLTLDNIQSVKINTIGFAIDMELLKETAAKGNGSYHTANSSLQLKQAFNELLLEILDDTSGFSAPAVAVNAFNSLQHNNELYYGLFKPNKSPRWHGNIKKYRIDSFGDIKDENLNPAISNGFFKSTARSFWSSTADGAEVTLGGAANKLPSARKIYTVADVPATADYDLSSAVNTISETNTDISNALYGLDPSDTATRTTLIKWILGQDSKDDDGDSITNEQTFFFADPLHSRPTVVTYDETGPTNARVTTDRLYAMTNDGGFHSIDTKTGIEQWSFIPPELLKNQLDYHIDDPDSVRRYGLDGPMTIWRQESSDTDVKIEPGSPDYDHVYAYIGMRRGGKNYYALDLSYKDKPKLMWTIKGGASGFEDLTQSWSKPIRSTINWDCGDASGCTKRDVIIFTGGYDPVHDNATVPTTGDLGAAIYIVDPETGKLLWSAGNNNDSVGSNNHTLNLPMKNSIPGDISLGDIDGDGADDVIFAVDILGHVWRIDINPEITSSNTTTEITDFHIDGGKIANLSDSSFRRFYNGPVVSLSQKRGRTPFFVLTMGTGYMASPKETTLNDRIYALYEYSIFEPPKDDLGNISYGPVVKNTDLLNAQPNATTSVKAGPEINANGFYKDANIYPNDSDAIAGEKFLRPPLTLFGITIYTSYIPKGSNSSNSCGDHLGSGRLYAMDFVTGESVYQQGFYPLEHPGIPPEAVVLFIADDNGKTKPILCVGTECFGQDDDQNPFEEVTTQILYWRENAE